MRRSIAAVATGGAVALVLTGCGLPDRVDGDMTDNWGDFGEPVAFVPTTGTCHQGPFAQTGTLGDYHPVDCDQVHIYETVHVGTFSGKPAKRENPPDARSAAMAAAFGECEEKAEEFLGADFRHGRLWLGTAIPSSAAWEGGARWFRCDLAEVDAPQGAPVQRESSLVGALEDDSSLRLGCFDVTMDEDGNVEDRTAVPCEESHDAEFVGVWRPPDNEYLGFEDRDEEEQVYQGCREIVADYVGVPKDGGLIFRTGVIADWMSESDWDGGDRSFRCYLWVRESGFTESLAGGGEDALPIQIKQPD